MTTLKQYSGWITQAVAPVARRMGVTLPTADKQTRVIARITIGLIAGLVKLLVDKGLLTDAEVQALLSSYSADTYAAEPVTPDMSTNALPDDQASPGGPTPDPEPEPEPGP